MVVFNVGSAHAGLRFAYCVVVHGRLLLSTFIVSLVFLPVLAPLGVCLVLYAPSVGAVINLLDLILVLVGDALLLPMLPGGSGVLLFSWLRCLSRPAVDQLGCYFSLGPAGAACLCFASFGLASASVWLSPLAPPPSQELSCCSWPLFAPPFCFLPPMSMASLGLGLFAAGPGVGLVSGTGVGLGIVGVTLG